MATPIFDELLAEWTERDGESPLYYEKPGWLPIAPTALSDPLLAEEAPKVKPQVTARRPATMKPRRVPAVRADQPDEQTADIQLDTLLSQLAGEKTAVIKVPPAAVVTGTHPVVRKDQTRVFQKGELPPPPTGPDGTLIWNKDPE